MAKLLSTKVAGPKVTTDTLLASAISLVPEHGWKDALLEVCRAHSMSDQATSLFAADDLIKYHYRQQLERLQLYEPTSQKTFSRLNELVWYRLQGNEALGPGRLSEAIAITLKTRPATSGFACLAQLADELWFKAGDESSDTTWYTRRGTLIGAYGALEAFQSQDSSIGMRDTKALTAKLISSLETAEYMETSVSEWVKFNTRAVFNVMNTWR